MRFSALLGASVSASRKYSNALLVPDVSHPTGNIASGPISTALLNMSSDLSGKAKAAYGVQGYGALIIFSGGALLASGVGAGYKGIKRD